MFPPSGPLGFPPFSLLAFPLGQKARAMPAFSRSLQWRPCRCSTTRTLVVKVVVEFMAGNDEREEGGGECFPLVLLVGSPSNIFMYFFSTFIHVGSVFSWGLQVKVFGTYLCPYFHSEINTASKRFYSVMNSMMNRFSEKSSK